MQAMYDSLKAVWQELTSEGGAFEIEEITVRGAPMRTFKAAPNHLGDIWSSTALHGDRPYLVFNDCLLYTSPSPRDAHESRMPSSA